MFYYCVEVIIRERHHFIAMSLCLIVAIIIQTFVMYMDAHHPFTDPSPTYTCTGYECPVCIMKNNILGKKNEK